MNTYRIKTLLATPPYPLSTPDGEGRTKADYSVSEIIERFTTTNSGLAMYGGSKGLWATLASVNHQGKGNRPPPTVTLTFNVNDFTVTNTKDAGTLKSFVETVTDYHKKLVEAFCEPPFTPTVPHLDLLVTLATTYHFTGLDTTSEYMTTHPSEKVILEQLRELHHNGYIAYEATDWHDGIYTITALGMDCARKHFKRPAISKVV